MGGVGVESVPKWLGSNRPSPPHHGANNRPQAPIESTLRTSPPSGPSCGRSEDVGNRSGRRFGGRPPPQPEIPVGLDVHGAFQAVSAELMVIATPRPRPDPGRNAVHWRRPSRGFRYRAADTKIESPRSSEGVSWVADSSRWGRTRAITVRELIEQVLGERRHLRATDRPAAERRRSPGRCPDPTPPHRLAFGQLRERRKDRCVEDLEGGLVDERRRRSRCRIHRPANIDGDSDRPKNGRRSGDSTGRSGPSGPRDSRRP